MFFFEGVPKASFRLFLLLSLSAILLFVGFVLFVFVLVSDEKDAGAAYVGSIDERREEVDAEGICCCCCCCCFFVRRRIILLLIIFFLFLLLLLFFCVDWSSQLSIGGSSWIWSLVKQLFVFVLWSIVLSNYVIWRWWLSYPLIDREKTPIWALNFVRKITR